MQERPLIDLLEPAGAPRPVVITAALTGGIHGKEANPALPEQPEEIVEAAIACEQAGAAIVHCHARDERGESTGDPEIFARILEGLRRQTDLLVNFTTGGAPGQSMEERLQVLDLAPDLVTLNAGTLLYQLPGEPEEPFVNSRAEIEVIAQRALDASIKPELEVYNTAMLIEVENLIGKGLLTPPYIVNAVLGPPMQGSDPASLWSVIDFQLRLPQACHFTVTGCSRAQLPLAVLAMLGGAHVRVGLEDNIYYRRGELAASNAQLVERVRRIADELGLEVASPARARELLRMPQPADAITEVQT